MTQLISQSLTSLLHDAGKKRDQTFGKRITYSPKVFIPLTHLCRDKCGYCTFAQPPARVTAPFLSPEEVIAIAYKGAKAGCHEALFTLGEKPELRYPAAHSWLTDNGFKSTIHYLHAMAKLVIEETGLLPHANAGAISIEELTMLREVSPSQGMMLETMNGNLECHQGSPDKEPWRRLETLEAAGKLSIPFTTGLLVGIGESRSDRIETIEAIAASHERHGHIQEVIVQNFLPKNGTRMHRRKPCPTDSYLEAIALARLILPEDIHVQAPPNLSDDFGLLIEAGIDDWGGVSPVTSDHVNPERPWPALDRISAVTENYGHFLAPRLTIYPEYATNSKKWVHEDLQFAVLDRSDSEWLGRDDPGAIFPERIEFKTNVEDGAEVAQVGEDSTQWYSGSIVTPLNLLAGHAKSSSEIEEITNGVLSGQEVELPQILSLLRARGSEVRAVAKLADSLRSEVNGNKVTYVSNCNINYTNVCTFKCQFCGFSKGPLSLNLRGKPYLHSLEEIIAKASEAYCNGATEVCLQGGIHPDFDGNYYIDMCQAIHDELPDLHIHGFTALEITEGAKRLNEPLESYLKRAQEAGLKSLPGTAAEILDDEIREILCPDKISTEEWLEAHRVAHGVGLKSNVTMMFGSVENPIHWAKHLIATRSLQKETGGFTEFVGLPFVHMASPIYLKKRARRGPTFRENLLLHAVARITYHGHIGNIQASWVKIGINGMSQMLQAGVNDVGGTLNGENISRAAGAKHGQMITEDEFKKLCDSLGRELIQRSTLYEIVDPATSKQRTPIPVQAE
ncbi:MAG: 5-amino-6-(D-ribitylamino)uracil--L-tyrosine 4-hydroxyphenyl transferase CofH [Acidimicrobiales bacterium]|nr:5-amino-6-(D-ribitylamino)uracil--L-tyrosine 4-hydroxyphenyl transferase CofH [Acidimicrobiales bacterium]